jgi:hypothetical protein
MTAYNTLIDSRPWVFGLVFAIIFIPAVVQAGLDVLSGRLLGRFTPIDLLNHRIIIVQDSVPGSEMRLRMLPHSAAIPTITLAPASSGPVFWVNEAALYLMSDKEFEFAVRTEALATRSSFAVNYNDVQAAIDTGSIQIGLAVLQKHLEMIERYHGRIQRIEAARRMKARIAKLEQAMAGQGMAQA